MRKILISSNSVWNLYNFRYDLINKLSLSYKVYILAPNDKYKKKFKNVKFINLKLDSKSFSIFKNLKYFFFYYKILKKINPFFYLSFTPKPNILGSVSCIFLKINFIPNITGLGTLFLRGRLIKSIAKHIYNFIFKYANKVYFHNSEDKYFFNKKNFLKSKGVVIPGSGVNLKQFSFEGIKKKSICTILYCGRIIEDKGLNELLEAILYMKKKNFPVRFLIVGDVQTGSLKKKLFNLINLNYVNYYCFQNNIKKYIKKADCVILPSYREGLPKSILEAQAMGKPALVSNVIGCRSIIQNNFNGLLFEAKSTIGIINSVLKFINLNFKQKKYLSDNAYLNARKKFDNRIIINQYLKDLANF